MSFAIMFAAIKYNIGSDFHVFNNAQQFIYALILPCVQLNKMLCFVWIQESKKLQSSLLKTNPIISGLFYILEHDPNLQESIRKFMEASLR